MELKEFIEETLINVFEGVKAAQQKIELSGGYINPFIEGKELRNATYINRASMRDMEFEVSLTKSDSKERKDGIAVFFGSISAGGSRKNGEGETSYNKVKFSIPVYYPPHTNPKD